MTKLLAAELRDAWEEVVRASMPAEEVLGPLADALRRHGPDSARQPNDQESLLDSLWFSVVAARLAFSRPDLTIEAYDELAESWLEGSPFRFERRALSSGLDGRLRGSEDVRVAIPPTFWSVVREDPDTPSLTMQIAAFGVDHPAWLRDAQARAMHLHAGFDEFLVQPPMPRTRLESLEACAEGTLGQQFHRLIVDNGYDVEVLDPDLVRDYHPGHDAANRRILQTHEIWHLVAGYTTSPLHEVAISGFQLAQFGHPYSRDFLATALTLSTLTTPVLAPFGIQVTMEGWRHGRRTVPLMPIQWDRLWNESIERIRERWRIEPYRSLIP